MQPVMWRSSSQQQGGPAAAASLLLVCCWAAQVWAAPALAEQSFHLLQVFLASTAAAFCAPALPISSSCQGLGSGGLLAACLLACQRVWTKEASALLLKESTGLPLNWSECPCCRPPAWWAGWTLVWNWWNSGLVWWTSWSGWTLLVWSRRWWRRSAWGRTATRQGQTRLGQRHKRHRPGQRRGSSLGSGCGYNCIPATANTSRGAKVREVEPGNSPILWHFWYIFWQARDSSHIFGMFTYHLSDPITFAPGTKLVP